MSESNIKISVVVPIYKVERFLDQTIDSLVNQSLKELEIILVDDGSPDKSGAIADNWAKKDTRIQVIHQKNSGYGVAVNKGLSKATGEYVAILESDDWIDPTMYEKLYLKAKKYDAEISRCGFYIYNSQRNGKKDFVWAETEKLIRTCPDDVFNPLDYRYILDVHSALWTYIYKRSFLVKNGIKLDSERRAYQDMPFIFEVLTQATKMVVVKEYLHHYRMEVNQGSSSTTVSPRSMDMIYISELTRDILRKNKKLLLIYDEFYKHCILSNQYFYERTPEELKEQYRNSMHDFFCECDWNLSDGLDREYYDWYHMIKGHVSSEKNIKLSNKKKYLPNASHIVFTCDANYCKYFSVSLLSLIEHTNSESNYVIHIVYDGFSYKDIGLLQMLVAQKKNIMLNFVDAGLYKEKVSNFFVDRHLSLATYWRFFFPEIFYDLDKILYLDIDTIICRDIKELYDVELGNTFAGACIDQAVSHCDYGEFRTCHQMLSKLEIHDFSLYFNAGVMLFNLKQMREEKIISKLFAMAEQHQFAFHDQDAMNVVFYKRITILDEKWNLTTHSSPEMYPTFVQEKLQNMIAHWSIGIIHYPGAVKPWNSAQGLLPEIWITASKNSPFFNHYEEKFIREVFYPEEKLSLYVRMKKWTKKTLIILLSPLFPKHTARRAKLKRVFDKVKKIAP